MLGSSGRPPSPLPQPPLDPAARRCNHRAPGRRRQAAGWRRQCGSARAAVRRRRAEYRDRRALRRGRGIPQDLTAAAEWFERLRQAGSGLGAVSPRGALREGMGSGRHRQRPPPLRRAGSRQRQGQHNLACSMRKASTANPTTRRRPSGSARPPTAASPTAIQPGNPYARRHRDRAEPGRSLQVVRPGGPRRRQGSGHRSATTRARLDQSS